MDVVSMAWRDVLVASWPLEPAVVDEQLPDGLRADTYDGRAWLSAVAFLMSDVRPFGLPASVGRTFGEVNLRTYVRPVGGGKPGIHFFNLDANDPVGVRVARTLFGLPYYRASMRVLRRADGGGTVRRDPTPGDPGYRVAFESERTHPGVAEMSFDATYRPTESFERAASGSLEAFLLERYCFYVDVRGTLLRGDVAHEPWTLATADVTFRENDLFASNGFDHPGGDPHAVYSPGVDVTAERVRWA